MKHTEMDGVCYDELLHFWRIHEWHIICILESPGLILLSVVLYNSTWFMLYAQVRIVPTLCIWKILI